MEASDLLRDLKRHVGELAALHEVGKALTSSLELPQVLQLVMQKVVELLQPSHASLMLLEDDGALPLEERFDASGHWAPALADWSADSPEEVLSRQQLADCLQHYLGELPPAQQSALLLRDQSGLAFAEIAQALATSEANVRVLLHRARLKLLAVINRYEEEGEC